MANELLTEAREIHDLQLDMKGLGDATMKAVAQESGNNVSPVAPSKSMSSRSLAIVPQPAHKLSITALTKSHDNAFYGEISDLGFLRLQDTTPLVSSRGPKHLNKSHAVYQLDLYFWKPRVLLALSEVAELFGGDAALEHAKEMLKQLCQQLGKQISDTSSHAMKTDVIQQTRSPRNTISRLIRNPLNKSAPSSLFGSNSTLDTSLIFTPDSVVIKRDKSKLGRNSQDEINTTQQHQLQSPTDPADDDVGNAMQNMISQAYCIFAHIHYASMRRDSFLTWADKAVRKRDRHQIRADVGARLLATRVLAAAVESNNQSYDERITACRAMIISIDLRNLSSNTVGFCKSILTVVHAGLGEWTQAKLHARETFERLPPTSPYVARQHISIAFCEFLTLRGQHNSLPDHFRRLKHSFDGGYSQWGTLGEALFALTQGRDEPALEIIDALNNQSFQSAYQNQIEIIARSIQAMSRYRQARRKLLNGAPAAGALSVAFEAAISVVEKLKEAGDFPLDFKLLVALMFIAEVLYQVFVLEKMEVGGEQFKTLMRFKDQYKAFKLVYPIALGPYNLFAGRMHWVRKQHKAATEQWTKGLESASQLGLTHTKAMLLFELGKANQQMQHLQQAKSEFYALKDHLMCQEVDSFS
eukprot:c20066_g1_i1.p1 GENE.c20066_g1_i1~~c20066_g1_i1.p1  ORF type:complete len:642 (+),score=145.67 c20066_g1_i1:1-1926(+)